MRTFVQPRRRTISRRILVRTEAKKNSEWFLFFYYHWQKIAGSVAVIAIIYISFFYNRNPIKQVTFSQDTYNTMDYKEAFQFIENTVVGKGYYKSVYSNWSTITQTVRKQFPLIKSIKAVGFEQGTLTIAITYNTPDFIAQTSDTGQWLVYRNNFIENPPGTTLGQSGYTLNLSIPNNMIATHSGGIFWHIGSQDLLQVMKKVDFLSGDNIQYMYFPGWEKLKITKDNQSYIIPLDIKKIEKILKKRQSIIPYLPSSDPFSVDLSDIDRIIIKQ